MKKLFTLFIAIFFTSYLVAEEAKSYTQYDTFRFTVDNKSTKEFTKNMRSHINNYHAKGTLITKIYNVNYGANTNELIWVMGPISYAEFDSRPDDKKHDDDWADNINPHITSYKQGEIWRQMDGLVINNMGKKSISPEKYITRYLTINPNQDEKVIKLLLKQIKATLEKIGKEKYWAVMENQLIQGNLNGRHIMAISSMDSWAELDEDLEFTKHFEYLNGKGSIKVFDALYKTVFKNEWQEVIVVNKKMSGM
jgi:hypothetical protein